MVEKEPPFLRYVLLYHVPHSTDAKGCLAAITHGLKDRQKLNNAERKAKMKNDLSDRQTKLENTGKWKYDSIADKCTKFKTYITSLTNLTPN